MVHECGYIDLLLYFLYSADTSGDYTLCLCAAINMAGQESLWYSDAISFGYRYPVMG